MLGLLLADVVARLRYSGRSAGWQRYTSTAALRQFPRTTTELAA